MSQAAGAYAPDPGGNRIRTPIPEIRTLAPKFGQHPEVLVQWGRVMAYTFDSLGYAKKLRDGGVPQDQAEAHAEAARDFIMAELATKADVLAVKQDLHTAKQELQNSIDTLSLRLTVRLGTIVVVGLGALAAVLKLT